MKLKVDENGVAEVKDGHPVYIKDDGTEIPFDAPKAMATITKLIGESKSHREKADALESKFGDLDPDEARKAIDQVKNFGDKDLVEAGEVEKVKAAAIEAVESKYKPVIEENERLKSSLSATKLDSVFNGSNFVKESVAVPGRLLRSTFERHFETDSDGNVIAYHDADKQSRIMSQKNPGDAAEFDEAISILVSQHPDRDSILKGTGSGGGGTKQPNGGGGEKRTMTRAAYDGLQPAQRQNLAPDIKQGALVISD